MWKQQLKRWLIDGLCWSAWHVLKLRYRIKIVGLESLTKSRLNRKGGVLLLPNHPAEIDPVIVILILWKAFRPRPLVVETFYYIKVARFFMDCVGAMPLPNMDGASNKWKLKKIDKLFAAVSEALKRGDNFLIYPAGRLKLTGMEAIGGASFVHNLIKECPDSNVVLIRTTGMWGSVFSRALTGKVPDFGSALWQSFKILLKNGIFFAPRREVRVDITPPSPDFPYAASRLDLNRYLEQWYNRYPNPGPEPLKLVSYSFWKEDLPEVALAQESKPSSTVARIPAAVEKEVFLKLAALSRRSIGQIDRMMHLSIDLGLDSLDIAQLYVFLDEKYDVADLPPGELQTVEDLLKAAAGYKNEAQYSHEPIKSKWPDESSRKEPRPPEGETLQESFLTVCQRMNTSIACADALSGILSYRKLKMIVLILAQKVAQMPGERIGVLLPASVSSYALIFAILIAKKVPVMLNWTVGSRSLDHGVKIADLKTVLTSRRFLDRLESGDLGVVEERLVLLEDVADAVSWKDKLRGLWLSLKDSRQLMKKFDLLDVKKTDHAVILFTSGTESLPKAVPLSHNNLLTNQRAAFECFDFKPEDIIYGVLPPFHSFGFSPTGLFPILCGIKICYAPDPTDSHAIAHDIAHWKATLFCCAPSFLRGLFRVAHPEQLSTLRITVSGAEKTPQELFDYVERLGNGHQLIEGYGITECSPIVSVNRLYKQRKGVGEPVSGVELCIVDPETLQPLPEGEDGEICIAGPNVFGGYLDGKRNPFLELNGKHWYRSGDRGHLDQDGSLILSGRLKRFAKIGAEMVSLVGLEEEIGRLALEKNWQPGPSEAPTLAISIREKDSEGRPAIVLFATFEIDRESINTALRECGYGRIVKIAEVRRIAQIPLTGTGKTHYRILDEM